MPGSSKKKASNIEINQGSILLLFSDEDAKIARNWDSPRKMVEPTLPVRLLTRENIRALGATFTRMFPVEEAPCFGALLLAIDDADREIGNGRLRSKLAPA